MMNLRTLGQKKNVKVVSLVIAAFFVLSIVGLALSQSNVSAAPTAKSEVGVVNVQMLWGSMPEVTAAQKTLQEKADALKKEFDAKVATLSSDKEKQDYSAQMQQRMAQEEQQVLAPIQNKINAAIKKVAEVKGVAVVLSQDQVVYGGTDITPDVAKELGIK